MIPWRRNSMCPLLRRNMEQSDLSLLQTVPPYHLQALVKARRLPYSFKGQNMSKMPDPSSMTITEIAHYLFDPTSCSDTLRGLAGMEKAFLRELVACGGRANSRDLALYFSLLNVPPGDAPELDRKISPIGNYSEVSLRTHPHHQGVPPQYPTPHPHGVFEQALHRLLLLGLLFWGKQTNFVGRDYASGVYDGLLIVPQSVMEAANELWNTREKAAMHSPAHGQVSGNDKEVDHALEGASEGIRALQRNLYRYWSLVATMREEMPLINNRLLSRPILRQVFHQL